MVVGTQGGSRNGAAKLIPRIPLERVLVGVSQVDPIQDIVQGLHDRLYSRMFNS